MAETRRRFFVSFSGNSSSSSAGAAYEFKSHLVKLLKRTDGEVYVFVDPNCAPLNRPIKPEVNAAIDQAEHLICLIGNKYLESIWCLYEFWRFFRRTKREPVFVFTRFIDEDKYADPDTFRRWIDRGIDKIASDKDFTADEVTQLKEFAKGEWAAGLVAASGAHRRVIWRDPSDWEYAGRQLKSHLKGAQCPALVDYAALSAYCLGADRYRIGGWGFSLPDDYNYDGDDDNEPSGPFGLNVVILRALSYFLDVSALVEQRDLIFQDEHVSRHPYQAVRDRLPYFAGLLACLESRGAAIGSLSQRAKAAQESLNARKAEISDHAEADYFEPTSRWTLVNSADISSSDEYQCIVLACLSQAEEILSPAQAWSRDGSVAKTIRVLFEKELKKTWLAKGPLADPHFEKFPDLALDAIKRNDLCKLLVRSSSECPTAPHRLRLGAKASVTWLMLAGSDQGRRLLTQYISGFSDKEESELVQKIEDSIKAPIQHDKEAQQNLTISLVVCAAIMECRGLLPSRILDSLCTNLFDCSKCYDIVPNLNALAWAAILFIAFRSAESLIDPEILSKAWDLGISLRDKRLEAVTRLASEEQLDPTATQRHEGLKNLPSEKKLWLEFDADWWIKNAQICMMEDNISRKQHGEQFVASMWDATFWGPEPEIHEDVDQQTILAGVLRVNLATNHIELDSPGYSRIFLHPFSLITKMNVLKLNDIRREFGDDTELVRIMGETVVGEVFVRSGRRYESIGFKFANRTEDIIKMFRGEKKNWPPENGVDDFLQVRTGPDPTEFRWIHRSAIVQKPRRPIADPIISWRFVEMPSAVVEMIVGASRAA